MYYRDTPHIEINTGKGRDFCGLYILQIYLTLLTWEVNVGRAWPAVDSCSDRSLQLAGNEADLAWPSAVLGAQPKLGCLYMYFRMAYVPYRQIHKY